MIQDRLTNNSSCDFQTMHMPLPIYCLLDSQGGKLCSWDWPSEYSAWLTGRSGCCLHGAGAWGVSC